MRIIILAACIILLFSFSIFAGELKVGQKAPVISGKNSRGTGLLNLNMLMKKLERKTDSNGKFIEKDGKYVWDLKKQVVVLNFFSTSCIPCIREIPSYNKIADKFKGKPVELLYVNVDVEVTIPKLQRFIIKKNIKLPMMLPNQRDVIGKYNVVSLPRIVVIDLNQRIAKIIVGFQDDFEAMLTNSINKLL